MGCSLYLLVWAWEVRGEGTLAVAHGGLVSKTTHHLRELLPVRPFLRTQQLCFLFPRGPRTRLLLCASVSPSRQ